MLNIQELVLDGMGEAFFAVDSQWNVVFANARFCRQANRPFEELEGKNLWEEFPSLLGTVCERQYREAMEQGQPRAFETRSLLYGVWQRIRVLPSGEHLSIFFEETRELESRFRVMADSAPVMLWISDLTKACIWFNKPWLDFTDRPMEAEVGNGWAERVHPDDFDRCLQIYTSNFDARRPFTMEYRLLRHDNEYRWLLDNGVPLYDADGEFTGFIGSCIDITSQKEAEEDREALLERERHARAEAERVSRLKDEFLTTLSHELRTPLNAVLGWSHLVQGEQLTPEEREHGLKTIERNARLQLQLIEDLLDVSRIISGQMRLEFQPVDMVAVVEAALDSLRPTAQVRSITLESQLTPHAGVVLGDASRLQQVVWNLLSNALKFTSAGGRVEVVLERVSSHLEVAVRDTGQGINPDFLPYVFERFRQEDASTTRRAGGLGIGLAIVRHVLELHGGTIRVESPGLGQGSTFTLSLPIPAVSPQAQPTALIPVAEDLMEEDSPQTSNEVQPDLTGLRILIVDDEADALDLLHHVLKLAGAQISTANSGAQALEVMRSEHIDLLVSDIGMPLMNGYELISSLRSLPSENLSRLPAIALTAYASAADRSRVLMAGFNFYLSKPVDAPELVAAAAYLTGRTG